MQHAHAAAVRLSAWTRGEPFLTRSQQHETEQSVCDIAYAVGQVSQLHQVLLQPGSLPLFQGMHGSRQPLQRLHEPQRSDQMRLNSHVQHSPGIMAHAWVVEAQ